jgi:hypothetical protein
MSKNGNGMAVCEYESNVWYNAILRPIDPTEEDVVIGGEIRKKVGQ